MPPSLRQAWTAIVQPADYEAHMAANGQAQANADLLRELFLTSPPPPQAAILFAGAGTGQMFDYLDAGFLRPYRTTFTDINPAWLARLAARLESRGIAFETLVDDAERPSVPGPFHLVVAILLLEHVDWRSAVAGLCRLSAARVFTVIQENPPLLAPLLPPVGTMGVFRQIAPRFIPRGELVAAFEDHGFRPRALSSRDVADSKKMLALEFVR